MLTLDGRLTSEHTLDTLHLAPEHPLARVLEAALGAQGVETKPNGSPKICWGAERYGLQKSTAFNRLGADGQSALLLRLTELNLSLSYFIEKSGHHFAAKMILTSETSEEKTLYALFGSEEATHLRMFRNEMWFTPTAATHFHPLLPVLSDVISEGSHDALVFVIQVLLEGFGIGHYSALRETCVDPDLRASLTRILRDEARHHGAGLVLAKASPMRAETADQIFEYSRRFIRSLETAHWIPGAFAAADRPLTRDETKTLFGELDFGATLAGRMRRLEEMFHKANYHSVFERLETDGVFRVTSV